MLARYAEGARKVLLVTRPGLLAAGRGFPDLVSALTSLMGAAEATGEPAMSAYAPCRPDRIDAGSGEPVHLEAAGREDDDAFVRVRPSDRAVRGRAHLVGVQVTAP